MISDTDPCRSDGKKAADLVKEFISGKGMDMKDTYWDFFDSVHKNLSDYYFRWYFDRPMVITSQRDEELHRVQELLARSLHYYAEHYREYLEVIPYEKRVLEILDMTQGKEYHLGTFRPDYIISRNDEIQVCEITSRFFGNGYFLSFFADKRGRQLAAEAGIAVQDHRMEDMLQFFASLADGYEKVCVVKSADRSDSIRLYVPFYTALGKEVTILEAEEIEEKEDALSHALILSALNQKDILKLPERILKKMIDGMHYNDFRSVFLAHDKRVFTLFFLDEFTEHFLSEEETAFLRSHVIPTYVYGRNREIWEDARVHKDQYILKHYCLGKSEKVFAGCMTKQEEWEQLWTSGDVREMILQPFISQRTCENVWEGERYTEYIAGTILCIDDDYYGTGLFRSSSLPVLNKGDDRKVGILLTDDWEKFQGNCLLL